MARQNEAAGDVVTISHPYTGEIVEGTIESLDAELSNTIKARESILMGFKPFNPNAGVFNRVELINTEKDFVVPPNVYKIRVVTIQGGQGGRPGNPGSRAPSARTATSSSGYTRSESRLAQAGGPGGEPGNGGNPGKVLVIDLDVSPGQVFHAVPGVGGKGAKYGTENEPGTEGTHSTFGDYTSADGAILPSGWVEALSGIVYAGPGRLGIPGGAGSGLDESLNLVPGPIIEEGDLTFKPGTSYRDRSGSVSGGTSTTGHGSFSGTMIGSLGGGAAYGADGDAGVIPYVANNQSGSRIIWGQMSSDGSIKSWASPPDGIVAHPWQGGGGADAIPLPTETTIGKGGPGGNGGGGQGAPASVTLSNTANGVSGGRFSFWVAQLPSNGRSVGKGSDGSDGGPGGIFVYYHVDEDDEEGVSLP